MFALSALLHNAAKRNISREIVRTVRNRTGANDIGIRHRKHAVVDSTRDTELSADLEDGEHTFDELESDFMQVHKLHMHSEIEEIANKEGVKRQIIKRKYFSQKLPNFLTWSEKLQIRYLHNKDPEEWNAEKLSAGFPALPSVIHDIATSSWIRKSENKIKNHDDRVKENWQLLRDGKLDNIPYEVLSHLNNFINRSTDHKPFDIPIDFTLPVRKPLPKGEFSDIITSYNKLKAEKNSKKADSKSVVNESKTIVSHALSRTKVPPPNDDSFVANKMKSKEADVTFNELQATLERKELIGKLDAYQRSILEQLRKDEDEKHVDIMEEDTTSLDEIIDLVEKKHSSTGCVSTVMKELSKDVNFLTYPEKIRIPRGKFKRGCTYKLNDCYYDESGLFLYRVPGMEQ